MLKLLTIGMAVVGLAAGGIALSRLLNLYEEVQAAGQPIAAVTGEAPEQSAAPAGEHGGEHGAQASAHGGGHGAPAAEGHGGAPAAGEHGAAPAGHDRHLASASTSPLVSIEEVVANINAEKTEKSHLLGIKLELELFDETSRGVLDQHQAGIRNTVLLTSMEQSFEGLSSVSGKLYYKELLVTRLNEFFHLPVIRDVHFSSFYLQ